jgi:hypothetical protein
MTDLVTISRFQVLPEAEAARMHLQSHGISAFLADAEVVNMDWLLGNALGYIKLQVPAEQAEEVSAILERQQPDLDQSEGENQSDAEDCCLECGAKLIPNQAKCAACGWTYSENEPASETPEPAEEGEEESPSVMDKLCDLKQPIFMLWLVPVFAGVGLLALAIVGWLLRITF